MAAKKKPVKKPARREASPLGGRSAKKSAPKKSTRKPRKTAAQKFLRIGDRSPAEGGVFMGIARGEKGQPDCYVYRGRYADREMNHADALKFAADCRDGKHADWELPNRTTGALIYANGRDDMRAGWHWLQETYAGDGASAWCQLFSYGGQGLSHESYEFAVVLVRRVPIR